MYSLCYINKFSQEHGQVFTFFSSPPEPKLGNETELPKLCSFPKIASASQNFEAVY